MKEKYIIVSVLVLIICFFLISCATSAPELHPASSKNIPRFHAAASRNDLETVKKLIAGGQDINEKFGKNGNTALEYAAIKDSFDVAEYLIKSGANIELGDRKGIDNCKK